MMNGLTISHDVSHGAPQSAASTTTRSSRAVADAPKDIALTQITRENLYKAFGFGKTTWFELHKRWSKDSSETGLQGARTILAWTEDPDALLPENSSRRRLFKAIGNLPFGDLPSQAILDRRTGRLNIVQGP